LQEADNDLADAGRVPRTVEIELIADLVDACIPGDLVTVVGVVKSVNSDLKSGKSGKRAMANSLFLLYVEANSITNSRQRSGGAGPQEFSKVRANCRCEIYPCMTLRPRTSAAETTHTSRFPARHPVSPQEPRQRGHVGRTVLDGRSL